MKYSFVFISSFLKKLQNSKNEGLFEKASLGFFISHSPWVLWLLIIYETKMLSYLPFMIYILPLSLSESPSVSQSGAWILPIIFPSGNNNHINLASVLFITRESLPQPLWPSPPLVSFPCEGRFPLHMEPVLLASSFHLWVTLTSGSMTISDCLHRTRLNQHWPNPQSCLPLMRIQALTSQAECQESPLLISVQKACNFVHRHIVINTAGVLANLFITFRWYDVLVQCASECLCLLILV